jgi:hypothetical protein
MLAKIARAQAQTMFRPASRAFAAPISEECKNQLNKLGITNENIVFNPS